MTFAFINFNLFAIIEENKPYAGINMNANELMEVALKTGEMLLCSGAEIYRVEDTIFRIFKSYNIECECFVLLSGIFITVQNRNGEVLSRIKRIKGHSIDLYRIELVNSFARSLQKQPLNYNEAMEQLRYISDAPRYKFATKLVFAGITAFVYALIFKGSFYDSLAAFFISMVIYSVKVKISEAGFFQFFEFFVSGMIAGSLSLTAAKLLPDVNIYKTILGAIMILVPGVAITSGIKDALYGDIVSSLYRIAEAVFISIAVGAGVGIMLSVGLRWL